MEGGSRFDACRLTSRQIIFLYVSKAMTIINQNYQSKLGTIEMMHRQRLYLANNFVTDVVL